MNKQPHVLQPQSLAAGLRGHILTGSTASGWEVLGFRPVRQPDELSTGCLSHNGFARRVQNPCGPTILEGRRTSRCPSFSNLRGDKRSNSVLSG